MDLRDYLAILRQRWVLIASVTLATVAVAAGLTWTATPQYASSTGLFISTSQVSDDTQALQGSQFSMQRVKSYAQMVNRSAVANRVIERLELDETTEQLREKISASAELDTVILTITVTDESPERAQQIAEATADVFVGYIGELETPPGQDQATIKATVVDQARVSNSPVSPQPARNLGLGLVLGLLLGAGIAVLRHTLDSTIRNGKELEELAGVPVLGAVPFDKTSGGAPLISDIDPYSGRAEAFRVLRTNLQFIDPDAQRKVFVVTSALPGEGKSTTATNLALALAEAGQRVALVEGDMRRPRVAEYLGLVSSVGLTTVLIGQVTLDDALQDTQFAGLDVLTSGKTPPNPAELLQSTHMRQIVDQLRERFDVVLIDAPPLLPVTDAALLAAGADGAVLVVRHGKTTRDQVRGAVERLEAVSARPVATIFNMTPPAKKNDGYGYGYGYGYAPEGAPDWSERRPVASRRFAGDQTDRQDDVAPEASAEDNAPTGTGTATEGPRRLDASQGLDGPVFEPRRPE